MSLETSSDYHKKYQRAYYHKQKTSYTKIDLFEENEKEKNYSKTTEFVKHLDADMYQHILSLVSQADRPEDIVKGISNSQLDQIINKLQ
jgi:hypothetical protein